MIEMVATVTDVEYEPFGLVYLLLIGMRIWVSVPLDV